MPQYNWDNVFELLRANKIRLSKGLTESEFERAESMYGFRFPPDLRSLLSQALPLNDDDFPNWRRPKNIWIQAQMDHLFSGIAFDIEWNRFWYPQWGPRPRTLKKAIELARLRFADAPKLIPIWGHRHMPDEPARAGNPVFSVVQTDIIHYGNNLKSYFQHEFGTSTARKTTTRKAREIRFWSDVALGHY